MNYNGFGGKFEGEYIGNRKVKGKEYYDNGKLKYEGEYIIIGGLKGGFIRGSIEKNGKFKQYDYYSGFLVFEGEYLNGKRYGKGKEYGRYGRLLFEGEYINGKKIAGIKIN